MARFFKGVGTFLLIFIPGAILWGMATLSEGPWIGVVAWGVNALILTAALYDAAAF